MKTFLRIVFLLCILLPLVSCNSQSIDEPEITIQELESHINYLASDKLAGRYPGTEGDMLAATYIRDRLESYGLQPLLGDGLQVFNIIYSVKAGDNNLILDGNELEMSEDFMPFTFSENKKFEGDIIFAGYGFEIDDDSIKWDDYEDIDITNKWVLILRADPEVDNPDSKFAAYSNDRDKCMLAKDKGAGGVLLVSGEAFDPKDEFESLDNGGYSVGIPVFRVTRAVANKILETTDHNIESLELILNESRTPYNLETSVIASGSSELIEEESSTQNIIMVLPGTDPILKDEYVLIGGHFDHLGMGGPGTGSRALDTTGIHFGADDNASGVALMLEIAEKFAATGLNSRSIIFSAFAAEEMGLLGSKYLAENLPFEASSINAMINLDMVGRLKDTRILQVGGTGTAPEFKDLAYQYTDTGSFELAISEEGYGPSDHSSFYAIDVPVMYFSTGAHLDYHTPSDSPDKINYQGMVDISEIVYNISAEMASGSAKYTFHEAGPKTQVSRGMRRKGVTLGIMPDFAGNIKNGLRADFITPGKPADLGGMEKGDIITAINGLPINNIQDYMFRLSKLKFGETITVEVARGDKKELLLISL
jgi:hypothetical protein